MAKRTKARETSDPERVGAVMQLLQLGYNDYIGARTLLRAALPLQGAILGSSALEKYFKAFAHLRGNRLQGHLKTKHLNLVRNFLPELFEKLNTEFLRFLQRCYQLRYLDQLPPDFNLTVFARESLAELDYSVFHCDRQLNLRRNSTPVLSPLDRAIKDRSDLLFLDNYILLGMDKSAFLKQADKGYSVRNRGAQGLLEVEFSVFESPTDGKFNREALKPMTEAEVRAKAQGGGSSGRT